MSSSTQGPSGSSSVQPGGGLDIRDADDFYVRTLTSMLSALKGGDKVKEKYSPKDAGPANKEQRSLIKNLRRTSSVLIRNHEVVAVVGKLNTAGLKLFVTVNSRRDVSEEAPERSIQNPPVALAAPLDISIEQVNDQIEKNNGIVDFLVNNRSHLTFEMHLLIVETLIKNIKSATTDGERSRGRRRLDSYIAIESSAKTDRRVKYKTTVNKAEYRFMDVLEELCSKKQSLFHKVYTSKEASRARKLSAEAWPADIEAEQVMVVAKHISQTEQFKGTPLDSCCSAFLKLFNDKDFLQRLKDKEHPNIFAKEAYDGTFIAYIYSLVSEFCTAARSLAVARYGKYADARTTSYSSVGKGKVTITTEKLDPEVLGIESYKLLFLAEKVAYWAWESEYFATLLYILEQYGVLDNILNNCRDSIGAERGIAKGLSKLKLNFLGDLGKAKGNSESEPGPEDMDESEFSLMFDEEMQGREANPDNYPITFHLIEWLRIITSQYKHTGTLAQLAGKYQSVNLQQVRDVCPVLPTKMMHWESTLRKALLSQGFPSKTLDNAVNVTRDALAKRRFLLKADSTSDAKARGLAVQDGFKGARHCNAIIASLRHNAAQVPAISNMTQPQQDELFGEMNLPLLMEIKGISDGFGVSKRCCDACSVLLVFLAKLHDSQRNQSAASSIASPLAFTHLDCSHNVYPWTFPLGLPQSIRANVINHYERQLLEVVHNLVAEECLPLGKSKDKDSKAVSDSTQASGEKRRSWNIGGATSTRGQ